MPAFQVKELAKAAIFDKKSIAIVQGEVDVLARMDHPFIVYLFAVYQVNKTDTGTSFSRSTCGYGQCHGYSRLLFGSSNVKMQCSLTRKY